MKFQPLQNDMHDLMEERSLGISLVLLHFALFVSARSNHADGKLDEPSSVILAAGMIMGTLLFLVSSMKLTVLGMAQSVEDSWTATKARKLCIFFPQVFGSLNDEGVVKAKEEYALEMTELHDVVEDLELFRSKSENTSTKSRKELPAGWTSLHTDDGHDYFYNVDTGETVWELAG